ncbi:MAG: histone deacetylase [Porticoccaceae bacterium]|nr:histone deacetylase [Porticoccaceae bacterium]
MIPLVFHPIYSQLDLPERHRFPIQKYQGIYDRLRQEGIGSGQFIRPKPLHPGRINGALCPDYVSRFSSGTLDGAAVRRIGFPWSDQLVRRTLTAVAGTVLAGVLSLEKGRALHLTGGYHHGFYDHGAGFCIINDLYLSALNLLDKPGIGRLLIFDCDVHQGDGTARLATGNDRIFTVSIHGEKNFPFRKQVSDLDVPLPKGTRDDQYLACVEATLSAAVDRFRPDAVIYDAGVDIHIDDDLGHFDITSDGVLARDRLVFEHCDRAGLPVSAVIGGGYQRNIPALVDVHLNLFRAGLGAEFDGLQ